LGNPLNYQNVILVVQALRLATSLFNLGMVVACSLQASISKSLHLLQITTCSTDEIATLTFSILALKSAFKLLRLEIESLQQDNSE
jgi:hypothetical protein